MKISRMKSVGSVVVLSAALVLSGCSGDDKESKKKADDSTMTTEQAPKADAKKLPKVPKLKGAKEAVGDLTLGECGLKAGKQSVDGTLTNSTKQAHDFVVVVDWVNGATTQGRAVKVFKNLKPNTTVQVDLRTKVATDSTGCVPSVRYGTL